MKRKPHLWNRTSLSLIFLIIMAGFATCPDMAHSGGRKPMPLKGSFALVDENGLQVTLEDYRGSFSLIFFGYTYCPDVCPTNLGIMARALNMMPEKTALKIRPLFISVDPQRDTPEHLRAFTDAFHPRLVGLTGTAEAVGRAARTFGVYYARVETDPENADGYLVDHSANTFFLDPQGRLLEIFDHALPPEKVVRGILKHMQP